MKAILLAGGRGTRISRYIGDQPKCTLDIGGIPLIRHTVELLLKNEIECIVVLGYEKDVVKEALKGLEVTYYYNPFFSRTNSIASLWFAREKISESDVIIANADVYFEQKILEDVLNDSQEQVMIMDSSKNSDYLFKCEGTKLVGFGKDLLDVSGEYVGIAKIKTSFIDRFKQRMTYLIENQEFDLWWENILYSLIDEVDVNVHDVKGAFWSEIDFIEDYNRIVSYRKNNKS